MNVGDVVQVLVQAATFVALVVGIRQLFLARIQRQRDFESLFIQRFWSILDRLSESALAGVAPANGQLSSTDRLAVLSYLRLCDDELELWRDGWISDEAWRQWGLGSRPRYVAGPSWLCGPRSVPGRIKLDRRASSPRFASGGMPIILGRTGRGVRGVDGSG